MGEKEMMYMKNKLSATICFLAVMTVLLFQPGSAAAEYSFSSDADAVERAADSVFMLEVYDARNNQIGLLAYPTYFVREWIAIPVELIK